MGRALGPNFVPGDRLDPSQYRFLYHGTRSPNAGSIRRSGILRGGVDGHRLHIHLATCVKSRVDQTTGKHREGVKGDAYVQIETEELAKYHFNGHPVELWINDKGVVLTEGAAGAQPEGLERVRSGRIPAESGHRASIWPSFQEPARPYDS